MKLNPDAVRSILLFLEENITYEDEDSEYPQKRTEFVPNLIVTNNYFSAFKSTEVSYALDLLIKEGYISTIGKPYFVNGILEMARIDGLTEKGHDLLDNVRNDDSWKLVKKIASKIGGGIFECFIVHSQ